MIKNALLFLLLLTSCDARATGFADNNVAYSTASTATAAGTTTLTAGSAPIQNFTGSTTQTVVLPDATTMRIGESFFISNASTGVVIVQYDDASTATTLQSGESTVFSLVNKSTSNGTWNLRSSTSTLALIRNATYRSVVTTDNVGVLDETMVLSGASFTSTLPTAVGVAGKRYKFIHGGTSLTQVYTIGTTSSQTIGGVAGGSYVLHTNGEVLNIESDGANWIIVDHKTRTGWISYTPTFTGIGTPSNIAFFWRRTGDSIEIRGSAQCGTNTAVKFSITLPGSLAMDTAKLAGSGLDDLGKFEGNAVSTGATIPVTTKGPWVLTYNSTVGASALMGADVVDIDTGVFDANNASTMMSNSSKFAVFGQGIPISGWQP